MTLQCGCAGRGLQLCSQRFKASTEKKRSFAGCKPVPAIEVPWFLIRCDLFKIRCTTYVGTKVRNMSKYWKEGYAFSGVKTHYYWSSTEYADSRDYAWYMNLYNSSIYAYDKINNFYVWPVRSG